MAAMKWWGWGHEGVEFTHEDKPALAPFIREAIGVDVRHKVAAPLRFDQLQVPDPALPDDLWEALEQAVSRKFVSLDPLDRVVHARGKSLRDLVWQRAGELPARSRRGRSPRQRGRGRRGPATRRCGSTRS